MYIGVLQDSEPDDLGCCFQFFATRINKRLYLLSGKIFKSKTSAFVIIYTTCNTTCITVIQQTFVKAKADQNRKMKIKISPS